MSPDSSARAMAARLPFRFEGLACYTRDDIALWNWSQRFLRGAADWKLWIQDAWGDLLEKPAGLSITLVQRHSVDPHQEPKSHTFQRAEVIIGREPDSDIAIPTRSAAKRHARIFV